MICGEYAVLSGRCDALTAAVGAVARWQLVARAGVSVSAFGQVWRWTDGPPTAGIAALVHQTIAAADDGWPLRHGLDLVVNGQVDGAKVGLGTSAATVVAVLRACAASAGRPARDPELLALAQRVHRESQGGKGSGYDVATIFAGGTARYSRSRERSEPVAWPPQWHAAALFTGASASTPRAIRAPLSDKVLDALATAATELIERWSGGGRGLPDALRRCEDAFDQVGAERPWLLPPRLQRARDVIAEAGCWPRVSGAGGGDCVLGFSDDPERLEALVADWVTGGRSVVARLPSDLAGSG